MNVKKFAILFVLFVLLSSPLAGIIAVSGGTQEYGMGEQGDRGARLVEEEVGQETDTDTGRAGGVDEERAGDEGDGHYEGDEYGGSWFDGFEDESGVEGNVSINQSQIRFYSTPCGRLEYNCLYQSDVAYIYHDLGYNIGDFELKFDIINNGGPNAQAVGASIGISDTIGPGSTWNNGINFRFESPSAQSRFGLRTPSGSQTTDSNYNYHQPYYCTLGPVTKQLVHFPLMVQ